MIGVLVDHSGGVPSHATLEVMTRARDLGAVAALWIGAAPPDGAVATLAEYGAREVRVATPARADDAHLASVAGPALVAAAAGLDLVLGVSTFAAKEVVTRFAVSTGAGVVVDAATVELADGAWQTTQTVFAATWVVATRILGAGGAVLLRPNSGPARPADAPAAGKVAQVDWTPPQAPERLVSREAVPSDGVILAEAPVVVAGGRGTGGDYALIRELAEVLGGAVGASRDATDEGWIGHEHMVGQTGTTVTPALYVACGISGAIHHRGGMQGSGTIVAINTDPDAPIFEIADFGVVGDLFEVLPQVLAALRDARADSSDA